MADASGEGRLKGRCLCTSLDPRPRVASPNDRQQQEIQMRSRILPLLAATAAATTLVACGMMGGKNDMTFFVSSTGGGNGADFGGLAGADALCNRLAAAAGSSGHDWRAYLSTVPVGGSPGVNARDRIGPGPWRNAKGVVVAQNVTELHGANNLNKNTALTEKGDIVNG